MSLFNRGGRTLPTVTHHASELVRCVRNHRMPAERLGGNVNQAGLFHANVASRATVHHAKARKPDLLNASMKMALQGHGVAASTHHSEILFLIMAPFTEVILRWSDGQRNQQQRLTTPKARTGWPNNVCHRDDNVFLFDRT